MALPAGLSFEKISDAHPGAVVRGLDARNIEAADVSLLQKALATHGVLVLPEQSLRPAQYVALTKLFGELEPSTREAFWLKEQPEIYVISNMRDEKGELIGNPNDGFVWHTDQYYFARPTAYTFLYALQAPPEGGDTQFCSTQTMYEALSEEDKWRFSAMTITASHNKLNGGRHKTGKYEDYPDVVHPLVRRHPLTGQDFLYFSSKLSSKAPPGMDDDAFFAMLEDLRQSAIRPERVYSHHWRAGDLVIWDNRGLMHTATAYDKERHKRLCYRISILGEPPIQGGVFADPAVDAARAAS